MEITDGAVEKIEEILKEEKAGSCLRIFMAGGCCGGSTVAMDIAEKPEKEDVEVQKGSLKIYVHKDAAVQLVNATIDCDKAGGIIIKGLPKAKGGSCCG